MILSILNYLKKNDKINYKINQFHRFLEISQMSFQSNEDIILKQCFINKISGKNVDAGTFSQLFQSIVPTLERWFIITQEGIGYMNHNKKTNNSFREYLIYPKDLIITLNNMELMLKMGSRQLNLDFKIKSVFLDVLYSIIKGY